MSSLPAHPEVPGAPTAAARHQPHAGHPDEPQTVAEAQLTNAGIREQFDDVVSADAVKRLKPAPEPYLAVARAFDVDPAEVRLVAAHSWDVSGALAAGCKAAFVARPGMVPSPLGGRPDIVGADISEVVDQIMTMDIE